MKEIYALLFCFFFTCVAVAQTINIGHQNWMNKNLDVSAFRNGDTIPQAHTDEEWKRASEYQLPAWCYYDNHLNNGKKYGKLYNWYAVNDPRGLAPVGFHIPNEAEYITLIDALGGDNTAGKKMKSSAGWQDEGNGNNNSSFSGLPGGGRSLVTSFYSLGKYGGWWSSSEADALNAIQFSMIFYSDKAGVAKSSKGQGLSVRCLRD